MKSLTGTIQTKNQEDILKLHGFEQKIEGTEPALLEFLFQRAKYFHIKIPRNPFLLYFILGEDEGDAAYLYDRNGKDVAMNSMPTLSQIFGLSGDLTKKYPEETLVSFYQNSNDNPRFAIPILALWQNGIVQTRTRNAGKEKYHSDYWMKDEKGRVKNSGMLASSLADATIEDLSDL